MGDDACDCNDPTRKEPTWSVKRINGGNGNSFLVDWGLTWESRSRLGGCADAITESEQKSDLETALILLSLGSKFGKRSAASSVCPWISFIKILSLMNGDSAPITLLSSYVK
jgi:hypothetical protein